MKRFFTILAIALLTTWIFCQAPEKMSYQAVIRNSNDQLVKNTSIGIQISILQGSASGTAIYVERHFPTTNANGLATVEIGDGTIVSGTFSNIDWANGPYFLKNEIDINGGANYTISGTSQLISVPYALHARTVDETQNLLSVLTQGSDAGNKTIVNISQQGIGTSTPDSSAALDIASTTKGFLPPRMTETEMVALRPVEGLQVYNTTQKLPMYYDGSNWRKMGGSLNWIGKNYAGGIIFYIDSLGEHGLVCAPTDQSTYAMWGCYGIAIPGAEGTAIGTGNQNTIDIINGCSTEEIAAKICYDLDLNSYTDWYLPTLNELGLMYFNLKLQGLGDFADENYWSSLEFDNNHAWNFAFGGGFQYSGHRKDTSVRVRAVRAF